MNITLHMMDKNDIELARHLAPREELVKLTLAKHRGLLVDLQRDYVVTSNRESGFGRYDVMIEPREKGKNAYILEFKVFNARREQSLEDTVRAAHAQIEEKQYAAQLIARGIPKEHIRSYGFAFEGKKVLIG